MPRSIQIAVPAEVADAVLQGIDGIDGIIGVNRQRGTSIEPPGDVLVIQSSNDALRHIFSLLEKLNVHKQGTILTSDAKCLVSSKGKDQIESETNETVWDEMASLLRLDTNIDFNYLSLMFLSGAVAAVGLWADTLHLVIGAMVIAPAFEPLLRIPLGLVSGLRSLARRGAVSAAIGYFMMILGAMLAVLILPMIEPTKSTVLETRSWVGYWSTFTPSGVLVSAFGAIAGAIVVSGLRSVLTTGVMITLALIPSMSIVGMAIVTADAELAGKALLRWAVDAALVILLSTLVLGIKQKFVHRRRAIG